MPNRPRAHVLEEENERAFRQAVPADWVVRRQDPDYGVDLVVEIFTNGEATGSSFAVQLKATDEEDVPKALRSIRFDRGLADYYWAQPIPVLIVRYHAPSQALYARWWHAYNPLVAARPDSETEDAEFTKTVGFVFTQADIWTAATSVHLVEAVEHFRRYRSPQIRLPVVFNLSGDVGVDDDYVTRLLILLRVLLEPISDIVSVAKGAPGPDQPSMVLGGNAFTVALADVASITLDLEGEPPSPEQSAANLGCSVAMLLTTVGQANLAAQVAAVSAPKSTLITGMHVAFTLAGAFAASQRTTEVLTLISALAERADDDSRLASFALQTAVLARGELLAPTDRDLGVEVARQNLDRTLAMGDEHGAAADAYNLARALARTGAWADSVEMFDRAAELDPKYPDSAYFLYELGASLFEAAMYERCVAVATRLLEIEDARPNRMLHADATMYLGRFEDAEMLFAEHLEGSVAPVDAAWRLKLFALGTIRTVAGDEQVRDVDKALELADRVDFEDPNITYEAAWGLLDRAWRADGLCGPAWGTASLLSLSFGDGDGLNARRAVEPAICAAVLNHRNEATWANSIRICAAADVPDGVLYDLVRNAVALCGQSLIAQVLAQVSPPLSSEHVAVIDRAAQEFARESREAGFRLRLRGRDGSLNEFIFASEQSGDAEE